MSLKKEGHLVHLFDPLIQKKSLKKSISSNLKKNLNNKFYHYCFIGVKHDIFHKLGKSFFIKKCKPNHFIYDFKKVF